MSKGSGNGMTRGDRRRNARRERLRGLLPRDGAVIGIDLAEDKQAIAVIDHDVRVLARKTVRVKAFRLGQALDWAVAQAWAKGFERVTVACEPTGPAIPDPDGALREQRRARALPALRAPAAAARRPPLHVTGTGCADGWPRRHPRRRAARTTTQTTGGRTRERP